MNIDVFSFFMLPESHTQMFSRFFKPRFYKKCVSCVETIKKRLEITQKRRKAVVRFVKNDIAELLMRGLDYNAYQRAAGLLVEYNMLCCYELVEKYIGCIEDHLDELSKQRECPEECQEAVGSLIYGAARLSLSDLPELRELRTLFTHKYGNSFEPYVNKEIWSYIFGSDADLLVSYLWLTWNLLQRQKLRKELPSRGTTIRLLYDIAGENSIEWDSNDLEQQIYNKPTSERKNNNNNVAIHRTEKEDDEKKDNFFPSQGRQNVTIDSDEDGNESTSTDMSSSHDGKSKKAFSSSSSSSSSSVGSVSEDEEVEADKNKRSFLFSLIPPPYLKQKPNNNNEIESNLEKKSDSKARSVRRRRTLKQTSSVPPQPTWEAPKMANNNAAKHVHPKLPDYDDLAARLASIKGHRTNSFTK